MAAAGLTGCTDDGGSVGSTGAAPTAQTSAVAQVPAAGDVLFKDSFDDDRNQWGVIDDPQYGSTAYEGGDYVWGFRGSLAHWIAGVLGEQYDRGELDMLDVVVRAEATVVQGDGVIGVACRETPDSDAQWQWYEFVARDGFAAIRLADDEGNIEVLAETDDISLPNGEPFTIEAGCIDNSDGAAELSLALNQSPVLAAIDTDPLGNGVASLQAWTYPVHEQMDIRWHEFSVLGTG